MKGYSSRPLVRGGAVWQLVGLITRRSQVQILPPLPFYGSITYKNKLERISGLELPSRATKLFDFACPGSETHQGRTMSYVMVDIEADGPIPGDQAPCTRA
jgi:hypothetical protein